MNIYANISQAVLCSILLLFAFGDVWGQKEPQHTFNFQEIDGPINKVVLSPSGDYLFIGASSSAMYDVSTQDKLIDLPGNNYNEDFLNACFSPDESLFGFVNDTNLYVYNLESKEIVFKPEPPAQSIHYYSTVEIGSDNQTILAGCQFPLPTGVRSELVVWNMKSNEMRNYNSYGFVGKTHLLNSNDRALFSVSGGTRFINLITGEIIKKIGGGVFLSPDNSRWLVVAIKAYSVDPSDNSEVTLYEADFADLDNIRKITTFVTLKPISFDINDDLSILFLTFPDRNDDSYMRAYSTKSGALIQTFQTDRFEVNAILGPMSVSRSGQTVANVIDDKVYVYDISELTSSVSDAKTMQ